LSSAVLSGGAGLDPGVTSTYTVLSARPTRWFQRVCRYLRRLPAQRCVLALLVMPPHAAELAGVCVAARPLPGGRAK
jgi:hypothetical protein